MRYCGRDFTDEEIKIIRRIISEDPNRSRRKISKIVCETFGWYKHAGGLKDMSCRVALLRMQDDGFIKLPLARTRNGNGKLCIQRTQATDPQATFTIPASSFSELKLEIVAKKQESYLWNEYIDRYHYLGYKPLPGAQLRYFVKLKEQIIALFGFGAAAWKTAPRDHFIGWTKEQRERNIHLVVNNARFLLLPWVKSKNLASKLLSILSKQLPIDWYNRYKYRPVLFETFVECKKFLGTSYKAANWLHVGRTKGLGKVYWGRSLNLPIKNIYLYPLTKSFRHILCS